MHAIRAARTFRFNQWIFVPCHLPLRPALRKGRGGDAPLERRALSAGGRTRAACRLAVSFEALRSMWRTARTRRWRADGSALRFFSLRPELWISVTSRRVASRRGLSRAESRMATFQSHQHVAFQSSIHCIFEAHSIFTVLIFRGVPSESPLSLSREALFPPEN